MPSLRRTTWLLVLLAVLAGHASMTLHFSSHVAAEQQNCELCTHYSNFELEAPPPVFASFAPAVYLLEPPISAVDLAAAESAPYRQRAPPPAA